MKKVEYQQNGSFLLKNASQYNYMYFPLTNQKGMKGSITPNMNGDLSLDYHHYALLPVTQEDLVNSDFGRNVWFTIDDKIRINLSGNSLHQLANPDQVDVEGGFLYYCIDRTSPNYHIRTTTFIPVYDSIELTKITYKNISNQTISLKICTAIPIYGRSADNIRDHRHVTTLLNRAKVWENGIVNQPTYQFNERGHLPNSTSYGVFVDSQDLAIEKYWPVLEEFIGEGGRLSHPDKIYQSKISSYKTGDTVDGFDVIGAMESNSIHISPNETIELIVGIGIGETLEQLLTSAKKTVNIEVFDKLFHQNQNYWKQQLNPLKFHLWSEDFSHWLHWARLQPILRRIYGCSFLPHHDYGKGGRGWRDLWQDLLALILIGDSTVKDSLYNNFAGIRIDGSNATIIGSKPGEFIADRNKIVRVWSDHGVWPLFTTKLYIDKFGDAQFLMNKQIYFKDKFSHYTKDIDSDYQQEDCCLMTIDRNAYEGTILEHLILQNIIPYFNVGEHGHVRLEDADWNDGLDMAKEQGETIAFSAFYAYNLEVLANLLEQLDVFDIHTIELLEESNILFDNALLEESGKMLITHKHRILKQYFDHVCHRVSGKTYFVETKKLATILKKMSENMKHHIREQEWIKHGNIGWYNGYYDNSGKPYDTVSPEVRMELTGQVFTILGNVSTHEQIQKQIKAADQYLYDQYVGGYRLNTSFSKDDLKLGRMFGFAYGHKENGAMFSHMAMMYAYALFERGYVFEAHKVIESIYLHLCDVDKSKIYPGIPEYINSRQRGMYHYLTGSASWLVLNFVVQVFGIQSENHEVVLKPKLLQKHFINHIASIDTVIDGKNVTVTYVNERLLEYGEYHIASIRVDGKPCEYQVIQYGIKLQRCPMKEILVQLEKKEEGTR